MIPFGPLKAQSELKYPSKTLPFKSASPGKTASSGKLKVGTGAYNGNGCSVHCAAAFGPQRARAQNTSTPSAQWRGVVELFMVNKFDDGKREKYEGIVKKCVDRFIKEIGLE
jgi:hypothetical protein